MVADTNLLSNAFHSLAMTLHHLGRGRDGKRNLFFVTLLTICCMDGLEIWCWLRLEATQLLSPFFFQCYPLHRFLFVHLVVLYHIELSQIFLRDGGSADISFDTLLPMAAAIVSGGLLFYLLWLALCFLYREELYQVVEVEIIFSVLAVVQAVSVLFMFRMRPA